MNPLIINLRKITETTGLTKYAPEEMRQNTFRQLFEFMLDDRADNINPGYNTLDKRTAHDIKEDYEACKNSKAKLALQYISETDFKNNYVDLEDRIGDKKGIFHKRTDIIEGENTPFDEIQLVYHAVGGGGRI
jgi:hypothetical protein